MGRSGDELGSGRRTGRGKEENGKRGTLVLHHFLIILKVIRNSQYYNQTMSDFGDFKPIVTHSRTGPTPSARILSP